MPNHSSEIPGEPDRILRAEPGDRVGYVASADSAEPTSGVVRYVGPVKGLGQRGHWFGVELEVSSRNLYLCDAHM